jgi:uncharacterized HAD superfamily protein
MQILPQKFQDYLVGQPEFGMGYQMVDITTKSGHKIECVPVYNCRLFSEIKTQGLVVTPEDIVDVVNRRQSVPEGLI